MMQYKVPGSFEMYTKKGEPLANEYRDIQINDSLKYIQAAD